MNKEIGNVIELLTTMETILKNHSENEWASALQSALGKLATADENGIKYIAREILNMFGGAGSLSDLVIHSGYVAEQQINERFDALRADLVRVLWDIITVDADEIEKTKKC